MPSLGNKGRSQLMPDVLDVVLTFIRLNRGEIYNPAVASSLKTLKYY